MSEMALEGPLTLIKSSHGVAPIAELFRRSSVDRVGETSRQTEAGRVHQFTVAALREDSEIPNCGSLTERAMQPVDAAWLDLGVSTLGEAS